MPFARFLAAAALSLATVADAAPRLVLQITVDGLRADMLERNAGDFGRDGFRFLTKKGVVYSNARYLHANTETIVGHTTLATGATPAVHGMVGNVWFHAESGELGYNIEDPEAPLLPTRDEAIKGAQVDPAQKKARSSGRSPRGILVPTFSDTLNIASSGQSKVFGVSGKDRSAVAMAGKTGTAYWYSTDTGDFQTSVYYMEAYPDWVTAWNRERRAEALSGQSWNLSRDFGVYRFAEQDDRPYEVDLRGYGRTFPHNFGPKDDPLFFTRLLVSPEGDRLLAEFAMDLIDAEGVGDDEITDYLSVSFSSVDAVNHFFGPSSLENEDTLLRLDDTLARLFRYVDRKVGLKNTVIVLSADHGMAEMPEYVSELGHQAGRLYGNEVLDMARAAAEELYGEPGLVKEFFRPYLYLDSDAIEAASLDRDRVANAIARRLEAHAGIGGAVTRSEVIVGGLQGPDAAVAHNYHPLRSGDIYLYQAPYWFMFDPGPVAAMHGSPWGYDQHVPIMFAVPGVKAQRIARPVHPVDVAPTLSAILGLHKPAGAQGNALEEVVRGR